MEQIFPFIFRLRTLYVNAFLLAEDEGITLIDSGLANRKEMFLRALSEMRRSPEHLKHIVLTHHHTDHTGNLAALVEASGAEVWAHPLEAPIVRGEVPLPWPNPKSITLQMLWPLVGRLSVYNRLAPARGGHEGGGGGEAPGGGGGEGGARPGGA